MTSAHIYPENFLKDLEFDLVLQQIASLCATEAAAENTLNLKVQANTETLSYEWRRTNELLQIIEKGESIPALSVGKDIGKILKLLHIENIVLEETKIQQIRGLAENYAYVYKYFFQRKEECPTLFTELSHQQPEPSIVSEIDAIIDERAEVRTSASKELGVIRRELGFKRKQADRQFYRIVRQLEGDGMLADYRESVKDNRRVLAILPAHKNKVKGIFHGSSAKHTVMFLEPSATVEVNNEIAQLIDSERREVRKILQQLCAFLSLHLSALENFDRQLIALDAIRAKALWAEKNQACFPKINAGNNRRIFCKNAYHPVLKAHNQKQGKTTVPLQLEIDTEKRIIVISGPNAGGKSIALKTIGLLSALLQSGIPIPVHPDSQWCIFDSIMGDIGDHQSIENELSTYSSRLTKMRHFLQEADSKSLLLIDEFGSGSDPDLGSSLAATCLRKLHDARCFGIITTHFNSIKALAADLPGTKNAAMSFNRKNFTPLYTLQIGAPGSSYTFEVAERVGLSPEIINEAKEKVHESVSDINSLLISLQEEKQRMEENADSFQHKLQQLRIDKKKQDEVIAKLNEKVEKQRKMNESQSDTIIWGKRFMQLYQSWEKNPTPEAKRNVGGRFWKMMKEASSKNAELSEKQKQEEKKQASKKLRKLLSAPLNVGDKVKIIDTGLTGILKEIRKDKYTVNMGLMQSVLLREQIIPVRQTPDKK
jgi:DNA mismatch repair protein MutS2